VSEADETLVDGMSRTRLALTLLALLFGVRVAGQALGRLFDIPLLPPDELWYSGATSYPVLGGMQIAILVAMVVQIRRLDRIQSQPRIAMLLLAIGTIYLGAMTVRFVAGAAGLVAGGWFDMPISTPFHLVLAGWLLIFALHLADDSLRARVRAGFQTLLRPVAYPLVMIATLPLYFWLRHHDVAVQFAAYLPVMLGASAILLLEIYLPYRSAWVPRCCVVVQDALYLLVVQVALPLALTLAVASAATGAFGDSVAFGLWPQEWPVLAQVALMIVVADFMRYWMHRAAHRWNVFWRLHAVHHAPEELYFLNVGRFHPLEKSIQFLVDAAPFILIGVGPEVISAYLVFYSVNGFFQHSNIDLRLGPLNWIISGPELHRWHHSRIVRESESNFGNNLIVWDALFGTRFLPEREVGEIGLQNLSYPKDFIGQTIAPVTVDPNRASAEPRVR
jgi:sterol desaturase/sphingolipid hydroxylase (fatty acid hydroxylase superfamily)